MKKRQTIGKRILAHLLTIAMLLTNVPVSALAADTTETIPAAETTVSYSDSVQMPGLDVPETDTTDASSIEADGTGEETPAEEIEEPETENTEPEEESNGTDEETPSQDNAEEVSEETGSDDQTDETVEEGSDETGSDEAPAEGDEADEETDSEGEDDAEDEEESEEEEEAVEYTVTFIDINGEVISTATVTEGETIAEFPEVPEVEGMTFVSWKNEEGETVDQETVITGDVTLKADYTTSMPAQKFIGTANGVFVTIIAPEGAFPAKTRMVLTGVNSDTVIDAVQNAVDGEVINLKAIDISFYDEKGNSIEPQKAVDVRLRGMTLSGDEESLQVVHVDDSGDARVVNADFLGKLAEFSTSAFSVYAVVETGNYARLTVHYMNVNGEEETEIATAYVKKEDIADPDKFNEIIYDPGAGIIPAGQFFRGWTTDKNYDADTERLDIDGVRNDIKAKLNAGIRDGDEVTYYAMIFKVYVVTYIDNKGVDDKGTSLGSVEVLSRGDSNENPSYTVNMAYTPEDNEHNFEGWLVADGGENIEGYTDGKKYQNEEVIVISGNVTFSVDAPAGHWLVFNENGKGAKYNAPVFLKEGEQTVEPNRSEMLRPGYTFGGWFTEKSVADQVSGGTEFVFGNTLSSLVTLYARWIPAEIANYTVIIWKQNVKGTGYDFEDSVALYGNVGSTIGGISQSGKGVKITGTTPPDDEHPEGTSYEKTFEFTGFTYIPNKDESTNDGKIVTEGNTVYDVYLDRDEITINFYTFNATGYTQDNTNETGVYYYGRSGSSWSGYTYFRVYYYEDQRSWIYERNGDWYYYNNNRYVRSGTWTIDQTMTGLYGSTLKDNEYSWPSNKDWYDTGYKGGSAGGTRTTFLDAFLPSDGSSTMNLYTPYDVEQGTGAVIRFWQQNANLEGYTLANTVNTSPGTDDYPRNFYISDKYNGFTAFEYSVDGGNEWISVGPKSSDGYYNNGQTVPYTSSLDIRFNRQVFKLNFSDGAYGSITDLGTFSKTETLQGPLDEIDGIAFGADLSDYNDPNSAAYLAVKPADKADYIFQGWYADDSGETPYTFTTMPEGGITVYAKWVLKQYRAFLHPNAPRDLVGNTSIDWGSSSQKMSFRLDHGAKISTPMGLLPGYKFVGWFRDAACTSAFNPDYYPMNDGNTVPYDKNEDMTDPETNWGILNGTSNSDATGYNGGDRFWVQRKIDIYGKWRATLDGANGISVIYDTGVESNSNITDPEVYLDSATAIAGAAAVPIDDTKQFVQWVIQKWDGNAYTDKEPKETVLPGSQFTVNKSDAKVIVTQWVNPNNDADVIIVENPDPGENAPDAIHTKIKAATYTVQLRAEYKDNENLTPTHINWYRNDGTSVFREDTKGANGNPLQINEAVDIAPAQEREGYTFLGWARVPETDDLSLTQDLSSSDLYLLYGDDAKYHLGSKTGTIVSQVAADEESPYHAMFAVWAPEVTAVITGTDKTVTYTGSEQSNDEYTVKYYVGGQEVPSLPEGVTFTLDPTTPKASGTEVGTYKQSISGTLTSSSVDYVIPDNAVTGGTIKLIIKPVSVTLTATSDTKSYNGTEQSLSGYTSSVIGLTFTGVSASGSGTNVGEYNVTFSGVTVGETKDSTGNYVVTKVIPGTLTITKATLTITAKEQSYIYNGSAQGEDNATYTDASKVTVEGLKGSDALTSITLNGQETNVGEYTLKIIPSGAVIGSATDNYEISYVGGKLTISKTALKITANDQNYTYNGMVQGENNATYTNASKVTVEGLVGNDALTSITLNGQETNVGEYVGKIVPSAAAIGSATDNYDISYISGKLTITKATLKITAKDQTYTYNGAAQGENNTTYTDASKVTVEGLKGNDSLTSIQLNGQETNVGEYTAKIVPSAAAIGNATDNYDISYVSGKLTITKAPLTITADSNSKEYDGTPLTDDGWQDTAPVGLQGSDAIESVSVTGTITEVGSESNVASGAVVKNGEKIVTDNYEITYVPGTLKVTTNTTSLKIESSDGEWEYDGEAHTKYEYTVTYGSKAEEGEEAEEPWTQKVTVAAGASSAAVELPTGDTLTIKPATSATITHVAESDVTNAFDYELENSANYSGVSKTEGKLTITAATLTIKTESAEKEYDGTPLTNAEFYVDGLVNNETVTVKTTGTIIEVGSVPNAYTLTWGTAASSNYTVEEDLGTLTITENSNEITLTAASDSKTYDGKPLTNSKVTATGLPEGFTYTATASGSRTEVGHSANVVNDGYKFFDAQGNDKTANFKNVKKEEGKLTVNALSITITADSAQKVYDSIALTKNSYTNTDLADGDRIDSVTITGSQTLVGESDNRASNAILLNSEGKSVNANYIIKYEDGKLTVTDGTKPDDPTPVENNLVVTKTAVDRPYELDETVKFTITATNIYAVPRSITLSEIAGATLAKSEFTDVPAGETVETTAIYTIKEADILRGSFTNTVTAKVGELIKTADKTVNTVAAEAGLEVTKTTDTSTNYKLGDKVNYTIEVNNTGNLTVENINVKDELTGTVDPAEAFTLAPGESKTLTAEYVVKAVDVVAKSIKNEAIVSGTASDGTELEETAEVTVNTEKIAIEITAASDRKVYDAKALTKDGYELTSGKLASGDTIDSVTVKGTQTLVGSSENVASDAVIKNTAGEIVTNGYEITYKPGTLTVTDGSNPDDPEPVEDDLVVEKSADAGPYDLGDGVTFNIKATNIYEDARTIRLSEIDGVTLAQSEFPDVAGGEAVETTATYTITEDDVLAGSFTNTVTASVGEIEKQAEETVSTSEEAPQIKVTKTAEKDTYKLGDTVKYTITVENTGNLTVEDISVADELTGTVDPAESFTLEPGAAKELTAEYVVVVKDVVAKSIWNEAVATGTASNGTELEVKADVTVKTETIAIEITAGSDSKVYDGKALTNSDFELTAGELVTGDVIDSVTVMGSQTLVGKNANVASTAVIKNAAGENVTAGYEIAYVDGELTVTDGTEPDDPEEVEDDLVVKKEAPTGTFDLDAEVTFDITATNIYADARTITLSEIDGVTLAQSTFENVAGGATVSTTATYKITEKDILAGSFTNTVTAEVGNIKKTADATATTVEPNGHLTITKVTTSKTPEEGYVLGAVITYEITATNDGNLTITDITVTDELTGDEWTIESLAPGEDQTFETSYTVTEADILTGEVLNVATGKGTSPDPDEPDVPVVPGEDPEPTEEKEGHLTITKVTTSEPANGEAYVLGETIEYEITAKNDGNLTLTDITVTDELTGDEWTIESLAPEASETFTTSYTVTETDVLAGEVVNVANGKGTSPDPDEPDVPVEPGTDPEQTEDPEGHLTITKTMTSEPANGEAYVLGETIEYEITAKNDGNLTLTDITVTDELTGDEWTIESLAPEASETFTTSYNVTEADILAGEVVNVATGKGTSPDPDEPDVPVVPGEDPEPTEDPNGHLTIDKVTTSEPANGKAYVLGEEITYEITAKNDGNLTLTDITVTDDLTGDEWPIASLAPEASETFETSYTVTEEDVLAGVVLNVATAKGTSPDPDKPDVPVTPGEDPEPTDTPSGHLFIRKTTTSEPKNGEAYALGETINYQITATNTGNLTITNVTVTDELTGDEWTIARMEPGAARTFDASYTVTEADLLAGKVANEATAKGTTPDPENPEVPVTPGTVEDPTEEPEGHLTITKVTTSEAPQNGYALGDEITYKITAANDGNLTLTDITVTDDLTGDKWTIASLAPKADQSFVAKHTVTEADILAGKVVNEATAKGTSPDPDKPDVPVTPGTKEDPTEDLDTTLTVNKAITNTPADSKAYKLGETIEYSITVTNEGNAVYNNIKVEDKSTGFTATIEKLEVGATTTFTTNHAVTEADVLAGSYTNTVTAKADPIPDPDDPQNPKTPEGEDSTTTGDEKDPDGPNPPIEGLDTTLTVNKSIANTPDNGTAFTLGETIRYTITVTNEGNAAYHNVKVEDAKTGFSTTIAELAVGATATFTTNHTVTEADVLAGSYTNTVTATADPIPDPDDPQNPKTPEGEDTTTTGDKDDPDGPNPPIEDLNTTLTVNKAISNTPANGTAFTLGETIRYTITVTNEGNAVYKNVEVNDEQTGFSTTIAELAVGASETFTTNHTVTEADVLAGSYTNTVTAAADPIPDPDDPENPKTPEGEDTTTTGDEDDPDGPNPPIESLDTTLTVNKSITSEPANGEAFVLGETIEYTITVKNDGNAAYTNVRVADEQTGFSTTIETLNVGETRTFNTSHVVTLADVAAGSYTNTVTAEAAPIPDPEDPENPKTPKGEDSVTTGDEDDPDGPTPPIGKINLTITAASDSKPYDGTPLTNSNYTITGTPADGHTVNVTVTGSQTEVGSSANTPSATVTDADGNDVTAAYTITLVPGILTVVPADQLALIITAGSATKTYDGMPLTEDSYTVTGLAEGDSIASVVITGSQTLVGSSANVPSDAVIVNAEGEDVTDRYTITYVNGTLTVTGPEFEAEKTTPAVTAPYALGDEIPFTITVTNTSDTAISGVTITDENATIVAGAGYTVTGDTTAVADIPAGGSVVVNATHTVTSADILAGSVTNTATVSYGDTTQTVTSTTDQIEDINGTMSVLKTVTSSQTTYGVGDTITYEIDVINMGNVPFTNIAVVDELTGLNETIDVLNPLESRTFPTSYTVTSEDILRGSVENVATAKADDIPNPDDPENPVVPEDNDTVTTETDDLNTSLTVEKIVTNGADNRVFGLGDTIEYQILVTNTGNVDYPNVVVDDQLTGLRETIPVLRMGETRTFTTSHTVTSDDILEGNVLNIVTAQGDDIPDPKTQESETPSSEDQAEVPTADVDASMTVEKNVTSGDFYRAGNVILYEIVVTNTGNVPYSNVVVTDELTGLQVTIPTLGVGQSRTYNTSYTVTEEDMAHGYVENVADAVGDELPDDRHTVPEAEDRVVTPVSQAVTLRVNYTNTDGTQAFDPFTRTYSYGNNYSVASPTREGYTANITTVAGTITRDTEVTVTYTRNSYNLTINYVSTATGTVMSAPYTAAVPYGETYNVASPAIGGYTRTLATVTGTMPGRDVQVTVFYTPIPAPVRPTEPQPVGDTIIEDYDTPLGLGAVSLNAGDSIE